MRKHVGLILFFIVVALSVTACQLMPKDPINEHLEMDMELIATVPDKPISYTSQIRPVFARRCVVCHGCYDAPCQLKLSSPEGIERGANPQKIYNGARFITASPTRLFIDAHSTEEWRDKGFHSIVNEDHNDPISNLQQSVLYRMLRLKKLNPQPTSGQISKNIDLSLDRKQTCSTIDNIHKYERKFPNQGMPFAMPGIQDTEYNTIAHWIAQGAAMPAQHPIPATSAKQIKQWEIFLNGSSLKQQLTSRYLYDHLFHAHLHFKKSGDREFYRLLRSTTPPGEVIEEIATVRPYDNPKTKFFYRITAYRADIVAKDHVVYELSPARIARIKSLFIEPEYEITELPSWEKLETSNPFKTYADIPPHAKYQFLLDDARFFIEGFIKGPVCRGQIALNVIEDQFWVVFVAPELEQQADKQSFLRAMADNLELPSSQEGNISLLSTWKDYRKRQQVYQQKRFEAFEQVLKKYSGIGLDKAMRLIWDGDGTNPNAALTIFRHFDSASVDFGFTGDYPETAWIIDYPQFERIHYLLVAGFNVYGNLKHQLNTRLYMDFLRMEGEDNFLTLIPTTHRKQIRNSWYESMRAGMDMDLGDTDLWMTRDLVSGYKTDNPQRELYQQLEQHLAKILLAGERINHCGTANCTANNSDPVNAQTDDAMRAIANLRGIALATFPDITFVRVKINPDRPQQDLAYTIILNKAYKNVTSMFKSEETPQTRDYSNDRLTIVNWLEGSYPNFFLSVDIKQLDDFVNRYTTMASIDDYKALIDTYGVRRTDVNFWEASDWFHDQYLREKPVRAGLFDLNRYLNR